MIKFFDPKKAVEKFTEIVNRPDAYELEITVRANVEEVPTIEYKVGEFLTGEDDE